MAKIFKIMAKILFSHSHQVDQFAANSKRGGIISDCNEKKSKHFFCISLDFTYLCMQIM